MEKKFNNWQTAFGINEIDEIEPSYFLQCLSEANIIGLISDDELENELKKHFLENNNLTEYQNGLVTLRIKKIITIEDFELSKNFLYAIHKYLFNGVLPNAGKTRTTNLTKKESCLNGATVIYAPLQSVDADLNYDFDMEQKRKYQLQDMDTVIRFLIKFISNVWQAHPFSDGNTRTVSIFLEKYLRFLGFDVNNATFKNNSVYFRNALARANYSSDQSIEITNEYLTRFFNHLLVNPNIVLDEQDTYIKSFPRT